MSGWNHRILRQTYKTGSIEDVQFTVHEVYYDDDDNPTSWTAEPVCAAGDDREDLLVSYLQLGLAFTKPVLNVEDDGSDDGRLVEWTP